LRRCNSEGRSHVDRNLLPSGANLHSFSESPQCGRRFRQLSYENLTFNISLFLNYQHHCARTPGNKHTRPPAAHIQNESNIDNLSAQGPESDSKTLQVRAPNFSNFSLAWNQSENLSHPRPSAFIFSGPFRGSINSYRNARENGCSASPASRGWCTN